jgi:hypothetical protein
MFTAVLAAVVMAQNHTDVSQWHTDYATALKEVQRWDKPLFIVFDSRSGANGKMVDASAYVNDEIEKTLRSDYIRMFVDIEMPSGKKLAEQFAATEFPRIVVIDRSTDWQVYRRSGSHTASEILRVLVQHRGSKITTSSGATVTEASYLPPSSTTTRTTTMLCKT